MNRSSIRTIFVSHGFTIKEGQTDLKEYVYEAAEALLRAYAVELSQFTTASVGEVTLTEEDIHSLAADDYYPSGQKVEFKDWLNAAGMPVTSADVVDVLGLQLSDPELSPDLEDYTAEELVSARPNWTITVYNHPVKKSMVVYRLGDVVTLACLKEKFGEPEYTVLKHPNIERQGTRLTGSALEVMDTIEKEVWVSRLEWTHVPKGEFNYEYWRVHTPFGPMSVQEDHMGWIIHNHPSPSALPRRHWKTPQLAMKEAEDYYLAAVRRAAGVL